MGQELHIADMRRRQIVLISGCILTVFLILLFFYFHIIFLKSGYLAWSNIFWILIILAALHLPIAIYCFAAQKTVSHPKLVSVVWSGIIFWGLIFLLNLNMKYRGSATGLAYSFTYFGIGTVLNYLMFYVAFQKEKRAAFCAYFFKEILCYLDREWTSCYCLNSRESFEECEQRMITALLDLEVISSPYSKEGYCYDVAFSIYDEQALTDESKIIMELLEFLVFGNNQRQVNRAQDMPLPSRFFINKKLWNIAKILQDRSKKMSRFRQKETEFFSAIKRTIRNETKTPREALREDT